MCVCVCVCVFVYVCVYEHKHWFVLLVEPCPHTFPALVWGSFPNGVETPKVLKVWARLVRPLPPRLLRFYAKLIPESCRYEAQESMPEVGRAGSLRACSPLLPLRGEGGRAPTAAPRCWQDAMRCSSGWYQSTSRLRVDGGAAAVGAMSGGGFAPSTAVAAGGDGDVWLEVQFKTRGNNYRCSAAAAGWPRG